MSETEPAQIPAPTGAVKPRSCARKKKFCVVAVLILVFTLIAGWYFCPFNKVKNTETSQNIAQTDQRLAALEQQITALNNRLDEINVHLGAAPASADPVAMTRMQSDVAALSTAMSGIEAEVKRTGAAAAQRLEVEQSSMAAAIAFIQLRSAAEAGRGFVSELAAVKNAAPSDPKFHEILGRLDPYAAKGAPKLEALREEFISLESSVSVAVSRHAAQSWWERLLSEMKGLISIRPLHGSGAMDNCTVAEDALSSGDVNAALVAVGSLPADAQEVLKNWRAKAEARAAIDAGLHDLSDRLTSMAAIAAPNALSAP